VAEEEGHELQEAQVARQERPVVLEEQADVDDLPKLALTEFVVKTQFGQQDLQLRQKLELEKLQAIHTHEEEKEDNKARREQDRHRHWVEVGREIGVTAFFIVIASIILFYTGQRIVDPNASMEEKRIAYGIWGVAIGALVVYLAGKKSQVGGK